MENNISTDFQTSFRYVEPLKAGPDKVRVRCPQCFKLFSVSVLSVNEARPRFACTACQTQFWIPFPECLDQEELLGFPASWLEDGKEDISTHLKKRSDGPALDKFDFQETPAPIEARTAVQQTEELMQDCPKCGAKHKPTDQECVSCGIIFANYKDSIEDVKAGFKVSRSLRESWKTLINEFEKPERHDEFIELCRKENALDYAAYRYGRVAKACPEDEISQKMLARVEGLLTVATASESESVGQKEAAKKAAWYTRFRFSNVIISIGIVLMAVGYFLPAFRNIVGLGAATIFMAFAFRIYFPRL